MSPRGLSPEAPRPAAPVDIGIIEQTRGAVAPIREHIVAAVRRIRFESTLEDIPEDAPGDDPPVVVLVGELPFAQQAVRALSERLPGRRVIACAPPGGPNDVQRCVAAGVDAVVWETNLQTAFWPTLQAVCAGQVVVPRDARERLQPPDLTSRERQVLALVVMGLSNAEIATKLYVTESTVKHHLSTAFRKLGVKSRTEAARVITDPAGGLGMGILAITTSRPKRATLSEG